MKSVLKLVLFPLFAIGVYGADEVESVSATEGDSVTLESGVTEIQRSDEMEWRLNNTLLFRISSDSSNKVTVFDNTNGAYGGRLQPNNQTGDLKITNIKTSDSGEYKLKISSTRGPSQKTFNVSVVPEPESVAEPVQESGPSSGTIAGIVVGVIAAVAAAAVGAIAYSNREKGQMYSTKHRRNAESAFDQEDQPLIK